MTHQHPVPTERDLEKAHSVVFSSKGESFSHMVKAIATALAETRAEGYAEGLKDGYANCLKALNLENPNTGRD